MSWKSSLENQLEDFSKIKTTNSKSVFWVNPAKETPDKYTQHYSKSVLLIDLQHCPQWHPEMLQERDSSVGQKLGSGFLD